MKAKVNTDRYRHENDFLIVEVGVNSSRQLFNERDPSSFRERDLDAQFVIYLLSSVEEFPLRTKMKVRIITADDDDLRSEMSNAIQTAIRTYFQNESILIMAKLRKRNRTARFFFMIGVVTLMVCLSLAHLIDSLSVAPTITNIGSVGLIIIGWVAMWHPVEALLYGWWPLREQRQYFDKIAQLDVEVKGMGIHS